MPATYVCVLVECCHHCLLLKLMQHRQAIGGYYIFTTLSRQPVSPTALSLTYKKIAR